MILQTGISRCPVHTSTTRQETVYQKPIPSPEHYSFERATVQGHSHDAKCHSHKSYTPSTAISKAAKVSAISRDAANVHRAFEVGNIR